MIAGGMKESIKTTAKRLDYFLFEKKERNPVQRPNPKKNMVYAWDPLLELTITSPYVHSRVDSNTFTLGNSMPESILNLLYARVDFTPQSGTLDLASELSTAENTVAIPNDLKLFTY